MPNRYHHGDLRAALIAAAADLVEVRGALGLSLREVAREVGVSHAAPKHHFNDKRTLLSEVAADGFVALRRAQEACIGGTDAELRAGQAYVSVALERPQRYALMFGHGLLEPCCSERLREESSRAFEILLTLAGAMPEAGLDRASYTLGVPELAMWTQLHGAVTLYLDGALAPLDEEGLRALVDGMGRAWLAMHRG